VAAWLAQPGPIGSLSFVSDRAQFVTAAVVKNPAEMLQELVAIAGGKPGELEQFETFSGVSVEKDIVGSLGNEVTFAFDGPILPMPSWKLVLEVNDPAKLQAAIEKLVRAASDRLKQNGQPAIEIAQGESVNHRSQGMSWSREMTSRHYTIKIGLPLIPEIAYTFVDGYMIAAPSLALLDQTISNRMSGISITRSRRFTRLLPRDSRAHFSAMVYQNAGDLMSLLAKSSAPEQQRRAEELAERIEPMLVCAYGEADRIEIASQGSAMNVLAQSFAGKMLGDGRNSRGTQAPRNTYR
jgi:hypothetical protein